jgi:hypothetical protein
MLLTEQHIQQYKRLENPPQALYNALIVKRQPNVYYLRDKVK